MGLGGVAFEMCGKLMNSFCCCRQEHESLEVSQEIREECQGYCSDGIHQRNYIGRRGRPEEKSHVEH